jgi:hypothetical protein
MIHIRGYNRLYVYTLERENIYIYIYTSVYTARTGIYLLEIRERNFRQLLSDVFKHDLTNTRNELRQLLNIIFKYYNKIDKLQKKHQQ